ncbi:hypothetical protein AALC17_20720 [Oscillospiraceae bacterium 38-13]
MYEKLKEIQTRNRNAYDLTEQIPAHGQLLDCLAAARQEMRTIHQSVNTMLEELKGGEGNGG